MGRNIIYTNNDSISQTQAVAALADKAHAMLSPYVHDLMPPILRALRISDRPDIQCAATQALGSVISATGLVGT